LALSSPAKPADDPRSSEEVDMHAKNALVADLMAVDPIVVRVDASLEEADLLFRATYIRSIPVVDGEGALVGVIRDADLVAYRFVRSQPPDDRTAPSKSTNDARPVHRSGR
jgi:CBS-domain-containing membrane protein